MFFLIDFHLKLINFDVENASKIDEKSNKEAIKNTMQVGMKVG